MVGSNHIAAAYLRNRTTTSANEEQLTPCGMVTSRTSVISRCLGVLHMLTRECVLLKILKDIDINTVVFNESDFRFLNRKDGSCSMSLKMKAKLCTKPGLRRSERTVRP